MARIARVVVPGVPHHVVQRRNNRQDVFFTDDNREKYLALLKKYAGIYRLDLHAYCLMINHVHLVVTPHHKTSLAKAIGKTDFVFAQYINEMFGRSGHFWQNRFFSCPLGPEHLWRALRYVDRNPVRTAIIRNAWEYRWSSAAAHTGMADSTGKLDWYWRERLSQGIDWRELLAGTESEADLTDLRQSTHCGRPLDRDAFIAISNSLWGGA